MTLFFQLKHFQRKIISEAFSTHTNLLKIAWYLMLLVDVLTDLTLDFTYEHASFNRQFAESIHHYWTHIQLTKSKGTITVEIILPITYIPEEIWGIRPTLMAPRFVDRRWEVIFLTAKQRTSDFCAIHCKKDFPLYLQQIVFCFLQNVNFKFDQFPC